MGNEWRACKLHCFRLFEWLHLLNWVRLWYFKFSNANIDIFFKVKFKLSICWLLYKIQKNIICISVQLPMRFQSRIKLDLYGIRLILFLLSSFEPLHITLNLPFYFQTSRQYQPNSSFLHLRPPNHNNNNWCDIYQIHCEIV